MKVQEMLDELERNLRRTLKVKQSLEAISPSCILCAGDKRKVVPLKNPMAAGSFLQHLPEEVTSFLAEAGKRKSADIGLMMIIPTVDDETARNLQEAGLDEQALARYKELSGVDHQVSWRMYAVTPSEMNGRRLHFTKNPKVATTKIDSIEEMSPSSSDYDEAVFELMREQLRVAVKADRGGNISEHIANQAMADRSWN